MDTLSTKDVLRRDIKKAEVTLSSKHQEKQNEHKFLIVYVTPPPPQKKKTVHELRFVDFTYRYFIYLGFPVLKEEKEEKKVSVIYDIYRNAGFFVFFFFLMKFRFHSGFLFYLAFHLPEILNSTACQ